MALTLWWTSERRARAAGTRVRAVRGCGYKVEVEKLRPLEKGGIGKKYSIRVGCECVRSGNAMRDVIGKGVLCDMCGDAVHPVC